MPLTRPAHYKFNKASFTSSLIFSLTGYKYSIEKYKKKQYHFWYFYIEAN